MNSFRLGVALAFFVLCFMSVMTEAKATAVESLSQQLVDVYQEVEWEINEQLVSMMEYFTSARYSPREQADVESKDTMNTGVVSSARAAGGVGVLASPTRYPTWSPGMYSFCSTVVGPVANQTTDEMCTTCLNAGCTWCESGDYCFDPTYTNTCSSWMSGSGGACTIDLSALATLIIIIIVLAVVIPCICIGGVALMFFCGLCCFAAQAARPNPLPASQVNPIVASQPTVVQGSVVQAQVVQPWVVHGAVVQGQQVDEK